MEPAVRGVLRFAADGTTLCLNGHTATSTAAGFSIEVSSGCSFTLTDCTSGAGSIAGSNLGLCVNGTFTMYGGTVTGNGTQAPGRPRAARFSRAFQ